MKLNFNFKSGKNHFLTSGISHLVLRYLLLKLQQLTQNLVSRLGLGTPRLEPSYDALTPT